MAKKISKLKKPNEFDLTKAVMRYILKEYPDVMPRFDLAGIRMSMGLAVKYQSAYCTNERHECASEEEYKQGIKENYERVAKGFPDIAIYASRGGYHGLFLELKADGAALRKKDGKILKAKHLQTQDRKLQWLNNEGYYAKFAQGYEEAVRIIDEYMAL